MATTFNAWTTSNDIIASVKRKIAAPIAQGFLSEQDILDFAFEEILISQVPSVLQYHEEYFVWQEQIPLVANKRKYAIPERAIAAKLRDVWYKDSSGNLFPMTRINPEDKSEYEGNSGATPTGFAQYFLQGNNIVLVNTTTVSELGTLQVEYFLRPNRLVPDSRAAYISSFFREITFNNASIVAGDSITVDGTTFVAGTNFAIGGDSATTAGNFLTALLTANLIDSSSILSNVVTMFYEDLTLGFSVSNNAGTSLASTQGVSFTDSIPENISAGLKIDILQTRPGHSLRGKEIKLPAASVGDTTIYFSSGQVPEDTEVGDYIALSGEAIIPQIPTDLHTALSDRTCARILAALGDKDGVKEMKEKLSEDELRQGTLLNNRVEGSLQKVIARNSLLRIAKRGSRGIF